MDINHGMKVSRLSPHVSYDCMLRLLFSLNQEGRFISNDQY